MRCCGFSLAISWCTGIVTLLDVNFRPMATEQPIPTGGVKTCWMWASFDIPPGESWKLAPPIVILTFRDVVTGKPYIIQLEIRLGSDLR